MGFVCELNLQEDLKLLARLPSPLGATELAELSGMSEHDRKDPVVGEVSAYKEVKEHISNALVQHNNKCL